MILAAAESTTRCLIVVPCYNEGSRLPSKAFLDFLSSCENTSFLFVNDGSTDNTLSVLRGMESAFGKRIQILDQPVNRGKAEAVRQGILAAIQLDEVSYVGFWDADLATPLEAIPDLLAEMVNNDRIQMVFGSRVRLLGRQVNRRAVRHYLGRVFASFASMTLRLPIYDTQCGAKLFRVTPELKQILNDVFLSRWVFDVEILARFIALHGGDTSYLHESIYEFPLKLWNDIAGSKVKSRDFFVAAIDLWRIHQTYLAGTKHADRAGLVLASRR